MFLSTLALVMLQATGAWQSLTNTNFVTGIDGRDSSLYCATLGGVVQVVTRPQPQAVWTVTNTDGLPGNRCLCVALDSAGNAWVGTQGGGLAVVVPESSAALPYRSSELAMTVRALAWDGDRLLVGTPQGLYVVDTRGTLLDFDDDDISRYSVARVPELLSDNVLSLSVHGGYWVGTNRGLSSVDTGFVSWQSFRAPLGDSVRAIAFWRDSLLVGTEDGVALLGSSGFRPVLPFAQPLELFDIKTSVSTIYVATEDGLYEADRPSPSRFQRVLEVDARSLYIGGEIWVGCGGDERFGMGLRYLITGQSWAPYENPCIRSAEISDCAAGRNGDIVLCHNGGTVSWIDRDRSVWALGSVLPVPVQVRIDSHNRFWLAHFAFDGGLAVYDPASGQWDRVQWGPSSARNIITGFGLDRFDTKWVFNGGTVVIAIDSAGEQEVFEVPGLANTPGGGYEFDFDDEGRAWVGLTVGLVMVDYGGSLHDRTDDEYRVFSAGLPSSEVRSVAVDRDGGVWCATGQCAARWDGAEFRLFTTANSGILSNNNYRVRVDGSNRVWILGEAGLSVYDQIGGTWTNYTPQNSGLIANILDTRGFYASIALEDSIGTALIGTGAGLSVLDFSLPSIESAEGVSVFPNPCILGLHHGVIVDSLPDDVQAVEIRTLAGRLVAGLSIERARHRAVWSARDVPSGLYVILIQTPRGVRVEKVALVRP
jgi:streptogramin lyase